MASGSSSTPSPGPDGTLISPFTGTIGSVTISAPSAPLTPTANTPSLSGPGHPAHSCATAPVAEAAAERDDVGQVLPGIDADLQPEVTKAALVECVRGFHELADGWLHRQKPADPHPIAALAGEQLVDGQADRLPGDVVERVG